jgi:hypothetical protein
MPESIYLVGPERQVLEIFNPVWGSSRLEPRRFVSAESAMEGLRNSEPPKGVLISYPLWDATLEELLRGIRSAAANGELVPTFVVAPESSIAELGLYEDLGVVVLSESQDSQTLRRRVREGLFPVPRVGQRVVVRMEVHLGSGKLLRLCQSENLSVSGMLIRTSEEYPIGSTIGFEFVLPGDEESLRGEAQIVRHTQPEVEQTQGIGVRFVSLEEDGEERLRRFVG